MVGAVASMVSRGVVERLEIYTLQVVIMIILIMIIIITIPKGYTVLRIMCIPVFREQG